MHNAGTKNRAIKLRKQGKSLLYISKELNIAKSTASLWLKKEANTGLYSTMSKSEWMKYIQDKSHDWANKRKILKQQILREKVRKEIESFEPNFEYKKSILSMLYWAEGAKRYDATVSFANTDPHLCLIFITLLRECYPLLEEKFRIMLHLQLQHNEPEQKRYWSELLDIPIEQFTKTIWKKTPNSGKRYRQNYHGICFVRYNSVELQREITAYALAAATKITKNAPIV
ncbi:hypothetical protein KBD69_05155 [Candidatus Woesebacteria bacterium]|nr:hypothetical protein [Candidatus Woesebacteria bacterium]